MYFFYTYQCASICASIIHIYDWFVDWYFKYWSFILEVLNVKHWLKSVAVGRADVPLKRLLWPQELWHQRCVMPDRLFFLIWGVNYLTHPISGGAIAVSCLVWLLQVQGNEVWSSAGVNTTEIKWGSGVERLVEHSRGLDKNDSPLVVWKLEPLENSENSLLKGHVTEEEEKEEQFEVEE